MEAIEIDCSGTIFKTQKQVLMQCEYFKTMLEACGDEGTIYIDCNPEGFKYILEHLRYPMCKVPREYKYLCQFLLMDDEEVYEKSGREKKFEEVYKKLGLGDKDGILLRRIDRIIEAYTARMVGMTSLSRKDYLNLMKKVRRHISNIKTLKECMDTKNMTALDWVYANRTLILDCKQIGTWNDCTNMLEFGERVIEDTIINRQLDILFKLLTE